jgi:phospholipid-binding lipoprotein MlaA
MRLSRLKWTRSIAVLACLLLPLRAAADQANEDPWEPFNRKIFAFNDFADRYALKPVAIWYDELTPRPVNDGITHFFDNLSEFATMTNAMLQWKPRKAGRSVTRFVLNSTVGLFGIFDVAAKVGLPSDSEDFGQTLAHWGLPAGPYLVLPLLGPSTVRDAGGRLGDYIARNEAGEVEDETAISMIVIDGIDTRAGLLKAEEFVMGDRYLFFRDAYLSRREAAISDGEVVDDFGDEDFEDIDSIDSPADAEEEPTE